MNFGGEQHPRMPEIRGNGTALCVLAAGLVLLIAVFGTARVGRVSGEEVGLLLSKVTGKIRVIERPGVHLYNGLTKKFYVLDQTLQTLEMTSVEGRGDRARKDDLKIKTIDGSDVYVDLKAQYRIIPADADQVLTTSGPGEAYKRKWTRDYVRTFARNYLGELTTEEFYNAAKREEKLQDALVAVRVKLKPYGIYIDTMMIPTRPRFYDEYENMIRKKKLADRQALEEASKADAAKQLQETEIVEGTNKKNVAIMEFGGQMEQRIIEAEAEAVKLRKEADAYYERVSVGAEASFYQKQKQATGVLATKEAEAKGVEALSKALEGEGGRNMVKLEYAKRLQGVRISGQPFVVDGRTARFQYTTEAAAAAGKNAPAARPIQRGDR